MPRDISDDDFDYGGSDHRNAFKDGWSASGPLFTGGAQKATSQGGLTRPEVRLQCDLSKARGGPGAQVCTVEFSISGAPPGSYIQPRATVTWSVEGNSVTRTFDLANGTTISGTAEQISVSVFDAAVVGGDTPPGVGYTVNILVTRGVRASIGSPAQIADAFTIAKGASVALQVPMTAGVVGMQLFATDTTTHALAAGELEVEADAPGFAPSWDAAAAPPGAFVNLPPGTYQVVLTNHSGANQIRVHVLWQISG